MTPTATPTTPTDTATVTLVDYFAPWCGPCKAMEPIIHELKHEFDGKVEIEQIDVDQQPDIANAAGVMSLPTLHIKKGDKIVQTMIGFQSKEDLSKALTAALAS